MNQRLVEIMNKELRLLELLLNLLEEQYNLLVVKDKDVVKISQISEKIDENVKEIASLEIDKRNILGQKSLKEIVLSSNNEEVKNVYNQTLQLLDRVAMQKDTNNSFIKQQLFFTKSMIRAITPRRNAEVYDNSGKIRK